MEINNEFRDAGVGQFLTYFQILYLLILLNKYSSSGCFSPFVDFQIESFVMSCENCKNFSEQIEQLTKEKVAAEEKVKLLTSENDKLKEKSTNGKENELEKVAKDVKEVKEFMKKINQRMESTKDDNKEKENDVLKQDIVIVKDIVKDIQKSSHIIQNNVETMCRDFVVKSNGNSKDTAGPIDDSAGDEFRDDKKVLDTYEEIKEVKLNFQKAPDSSKIVFAGDRNLDVIRRGMVDFTYDLFREATFHTSQYARFKEFIIGGNKGIKLDKVTSNTEYLVLSFGRDDLVKHPDWLNEDEISCDMAAESIFNNNMEVAGRVAETCVIQVEKIAMAFKESKVIYVLPPPSDLNDDSKKIFEELREKIKRMENKPTNLELVDMKDEWEKENNLVIEKKEGVAVVNFKGSRLLAKQLFKLMNPTFDEEFCNQCFGMHQFVCPTLNMKPLPNDTGACHFCAKKGHKAKDCVMAEVLKQITSCPHCGSFAEGKRPGHVTHNPDLCRARYEWCEVCDARGHATKIHESPNATRAVLDRIGDKLKLCDKSFRAQNVGNKRVGSNSRNDEDQPPVKKP